MTQAQGGRRGRQRTATATSELVYAHTRHATSRAGDPSPHDHVLVANVVEMLDAEGGWKAADTTLWREHLHAATIVGRAASARVAVELGYAITPDHGPSGRLGHWRIAGIPDEVLEIHSKRAAEISEAVEARGESSYRARNIAARDTRAVKRHTPVGELMPRWHRRTLRSRLDRPRTGRLYRAGRPGSRRSAAAVGAGDHPADGRRPFPRGPPVRSQGVHRRRRRRRRRPGALRSAGRRPHPRRPPGPRRSRLRPAARREGRPGTDLCDRHRSGHRSGRRRTRRPGHRPDRGGRRPGGDGRNGHHPGRACPRPSADVRPSQSGPRNMPGRSPHLARPRVAGAGKTTAIRCAAEAYTAGGYDVVGTATSGQAARTLGREADLTQSRTVASLLWRLDHDTLRLTSRHVVVLDEAGMTDDRDMLRLLTVCDLSKAKVILVGDHRQLGPVGPGGALRALLNRHHGIVHVLAENVRQDDPNEREALRELRGGKVADAVAWYAANDRIRIALHAHEALRATVDAWYDDLTAGRDAAMYAWRRTNVDALNRLARDRFALDGRLTGPDLAAPGGRHYSAGDRIVTLAAAADGQVVTSERGQVVSVDVHRRAVTVRMDDGRLERLAGTDLAASWRDRRHWRNEAAHWANQESAAETTYVEIVAPEVTRLDRAMTHLEEQRDQLHTARRERTAWLAEHPEATRRLQSLDRELHPLPELPEIRALGRTHAANLRRDAGIQPPGHDHGIELDFGP